MKRTRILATTMALLAAACTDTGSGPGGGTQILLTDSPFPFDRVARVDVHIVRIEATTSLDTMPGAPGFVTVVEPRRTVNLLDFQGGSTTLLGEVDLAAGQYRALRLTINTALSSMTGVDGANIPVKWGVNGELAMYAYVEDPLAVSPSGARIVLDFDVGRSFQIIGSDFHFIPWIRAVNEAATGSISGTVAIGDFVFTPLANAVVSVYRGGPEPNGWLAATARTDAHGHYTVAYLSHGAYWVVMQAPYTIEGRIESCTHVDSVTVDAGRVTTVTRTLPTYDAACLGGGGNGPDTSGTDTTMAPPGGPVATVSITTSPAQLSVGDSAWAIAQLRDASGAVLGGRTVTWSSGNPAVLLVAGQFGQYAYLRPLTAGTATLTATSEGKSGSLTVTVGAGNGTGGGVVTQVTLSPHGTSARVGDTLGVSAYARNAQNVVVAGQTYAWAISDSTVFQFYHLSGNYVGLRGLKVGSATLSATSAGKTGSVVLSVVPDSGTGGGTGGPVAAVTITPASLNPAVGDSLGASANLFGANGQSLSGRTVSFAMSDTTVARITGVFGQSVLMRALKVGTATLTATSEGKAGTALVTVH